MDKQELQNFLERKQEALDFWLSLRKVVSCDNKIKLLEYEISDAKIELKKEGL